MYLDSDVLVRQELADVFDRLTDGIGLVPDPVMTQVKNNFYRPLEGFDMQRPNYNSGFIVLNRQGTWFKQCGEIVDFLYKTPAKEAENLFLMDQGIMNLALQRFSLHPVALPQSYNCPASAPSRLLKQAHIIHSTGPRKFWCYYYFDDFYRYYTQWIAAGGKAVTIRVRDSRAYKWLLSKTHLDRFIFVQLCPDFIASPLKALRFTVKKWLRRPF